MRSNILIGIIVACVAGLLGAVAVSFLPPGTEEHKGEPPTIDNVGRRLNGSSVKKALAEQERRIAALEREGPSQIEVEGFAADRRMPQGEALNVSSERPVTEEEMEAGKQAVEERWLADIGQHWDSQRHEAWASSVEPQVVIELTKLSERFSFEIGDVDCRTDTCVASLDWPDYRSAEANFVNVVQRTNQEGCATQITLPDAADVEDPNAPIQAELLFRCGEGF